MGVLTVPVVLRPCHSGALCAPALSHVLQPQPRRLARLASVGGDRARRRRCGLAVVVGRARRSVRPLIRALHGTATCPWTIDVFLEAPVDYRTRALVPAAMSSRHSDGVRGTDVRVGQGRRYGHVPAGEGPSLDRLRGVRGEANRRRSSPDGDHRAKAMRRPHVPGHYVVWRRPLRGADFCVTRSTGAVAGSWRRGYDPGRADRPDACSSRPTPTPSPRRLCEHARGRGPQGQSRGVAAAAARPRRRRGRSPAFDLPRPRGASTRVVLEDRVQPLLDDGWRRTAAYLIAPARMGLCAVRRGHMFATGRTIEADVSAMMLLRPASIRIWTRTWCPEDMPPIAKVPRNPTAGRARHDVDLVEPAEREAHARSGATRRHTSASSPIDCCVLDWDKLPRLQTA